MLLEWETPGLNIFSVSLKNSIRENKVKRIIITCYKCGDHYFLGHRCQTMMMMAIEELISHEHEVENCRMNWPTEKRTKQVHFPFCP